MRASAQAALVSGKSLAMVSAALVLDTFHNPTALAFALRASIV